MIFESINENNVWRIRRNDKLKRNIYSPNLDINMRVKRI